MKKMGTITDKFGFENSLKDCIGKTIKKAEVIKMPYGCTWSSAWAVEFTEGSRAFFAGQEGTGMQSPAVEAVEMSQIFSADEVGEMLSIRKRKRDDSAKKTREVKIREVERLKRELGL
jgi:hypothetical protein